MSAAGSFRRERETGVLELLLVSPLGENQIISGRLRGLWGQFLPAVSLLLAVWIFFWTFQPNHSDAGAFLFSAVSFLAVPVFGLYFSLCCRNFITAFLATVTIGLLLPLMLSEVFAAIHWANDNSYSDFPWDMRPSWGGAVCQGLLAVFCWGRLLLRLKKRAFPLERTEG
jgi:ABC-type transport system involved in cytochrome c biogenesis permease component